MIKTIRKLTSALCPVIALFAAAAMVHHCASQLTAAQTAPVAQGETESKQQSFDSHSQPEWRYTRFGWQDANEWATANLIEHPPDRRFDNLHPAVLAMLILFGVLVSTFWASNEWELAQFGFSNRGLDESARE